MCLRFLDSCRAESSATDGIDNNVLDALLDSVGGSGGVTGPDGLLKRLTKALVQRAMEAELSEHLGYEAKEAPPEGETNRRNGRTRKKLRTNQGPMSIKVPRDRDGTFEPAIVPKHQRHFDGFDDKIVSMYARGMSVREIQGHLEEIYGVDVSPDLISRATDAVVDELRLWQSRPLNAVYVVVYLDALVLKIRDQGVVRNKNVYLAVGVTEDGYKEVLGLWIEQTEGAKFWLKVLTEMRNRGLQDIIIACCDGLKGLPEAIETAFPKTIVQTCIVHMIRNSLKFVSWKERKAVAADLRAIYTAETETAAEEALAAFSDKWDSRYPMISRSWLDAWAHVTPFLAFPQEIRKGIYTTNAIESLNRQLRKVVKTRGHFPSDLAATKLLYLALTRAKKTWGRPFPQWGQAYNQFAIYFEGRLGTV
jgi:putative transposase